MERFEKELRTLINKYSKENNSDTPDFILAKYMNRCLEAFNEAVSRRDTWYGDVRFVHTADKGVEAPIASSQ